MKRVYVLCLLTVSISGLVASETEGDVLQGTKNHRMGVVSEDGFDDEQDEKSLRRQAHYHGSRKGSWNKELRHRKLNGRTGDDSHRVVRSGASDSRHVPPPPKTLQDFHEVSSTANVAENIRVSHARTVASEFSPGKARRRQDVTMQREPQRPAPQRKRVTLVLVQKTEKKTERPKSFSKLQDPSADCTATMENRKQCASLFHRLCLWR